MNNKKHSPERPHGRCMLADGVGEELAGALRDAVALLESVLGSASSTGAKGLLD